MKADDILETYILAKSNGGFNVKALVDKIEIDENNSFRPSYPNWEEQIIVY